MEQLIADFDEARAGPSRADHLRAEVLAREIDRRINRVLRSTVGSRLPNFGRDVIEAARAVCLEALLIPESADGIGIRKAFARRVKLRGIDAIRQSLRRDPNHLPIGEGIVDESGEAFQVNPWNATDDKMLIQKVLDRLPNGQKRTALLFYFGGATLAEAGELVGVSESTVRRWVDEFRLRIKDLKEKE